MTVVASRPHHRTQWAAQFAVASELCKRDYQVALTLGNHPAVDLMARSPSGTHFSVDVKGLYKRNFWPVQLQAPREKLFYVFAYVPAGLPNQFFVMTQHQVAEAIQANWDRYCARHGLAASDADARENRFPGVEWKLAEPYRDQWDALPA
jgi:hypothetical protein